MNYEKKIERLNKRIEKLEKENKELKEGYAACDRAKAKYELYTRLASEKQNEYIGLLSDLTKQKQKYKELISSLRSTIKKNKNTYQKAFSDIKNEIK